MSDAVLDAATESESATELASDAVLGAESDAESAWELVSAWFRDALEPACSALLELEMVLPLACFRDVRQPSNCAERGVERRFSLSSLSGFE